MNEYKNKHLDLACMEAKIVNIDFTTCCHVAQTELDININSNVLSSSVPSTINSLSQFKIQLHIMQEKCNKLTIKAKLKSL